MDERAPLLRPFRTGSGPSDIGDHVDQHTQFCHIVGVRPINHPPDQEHRPHEHSLYARALKRRRKQSCTYLFTATLINTLLLSQIVLGAALTGLGASDSSRIVITVFGALNTIIAGVIAFLKSRGQPVRSRMFRDDLSRVVDEIENSAVMWYGISADAHGYDAIDTDDQVTVRGEVARLTRLYDKAVKTNTMNDPDMYSAGTTDSYSAGLRKALGAAGVPGQPPGPGLNAGPVPAPSPLPAAPPPQVLPAGPAAAEDPADESPAKEAPSPPSEPSAEPAEPAEPEPPAGDQSSSDATAADSDKGKEAAATPPSAPGSAGKASPPPAAPAAAKPPPVDDPDASPATAASFPKKEDSDKSEKTLVDDKGAKS